MHYQFPIQKFGACQWEKLSIGYAHLVSKLAKFYSSPKTPWATIFLLIFGFTFLLKWRASGLFPIEEIETDKLTK